MAFLGTGLLNEIGFERSDLDILQYPEIYIKKCSRIVEETTYMWNDCVSFHDLLGHFRVEGDDRQHLSCTEPSFFPSMDQSKPTEKFNVESHYIQAESTPKVSYFHIHHDVRSMEIFGHRKRIPSSGNGRVRSKSRSSRRRHRRRRYYY